MKSWKQKINGAIYIVIGSVAYITIWTLFFLSILFNPHPIVRDILFHLAVFVFPVSISAVLGLEFRFINQSLTQKLEEVKTLSEEKQHILTSQNQTLEQQVSQRTAELHHKNQALVVEAALERVRSRTMAMDNREEIREVAVTMYEELQKLGFKYGACTILIIDEQSGDADHWVAGFSQKKYPERYHVRYFDHPFYKAQLSAWRKGEKYAVMELSGEAKKSYDAVMFTQTDFIKFPEEAKQ